MKKLFYLLAFTPIFFFISCENYDDAIADLEDRVEQLESTKLNSIEQQIAAIESSLRELETADQELHDYVKTLETTITELQGQLDKNIESDSATKEALEAEIATITSLIEELKAKDAELESKMSDLKAYVNQELSKSENWASATFATLEQYSVIQTEIAAIKALIDTYLPGAIEEAIKVSENAMKKWVNENLAQGYYDVATIDALLNALNTKTDSIDTALSKQITEQKTALEKAKEELTAAYEEAITDAIADGGRISAKIAASIKEAQDALQIQIDAITTEITVIKNRLDALETRIQSIRFIPEYSDGKVELTTIEPTASLTFIVSPSTTAEAISRAYQRDNNVVTAYISRTQSRTRSTDTPTSLLVNGITATADGILTVEVDASMLPADYWDETENANIFIRLTDGNNDVISEMIPTYYVSITPYVTFSAEEYSRFYAYEDIDNLEFSVGESEWIPLELVREWGTVYIDFGGGYGDLRLRGKCADGTNGHSFTISGNDITCSGDIRTLIDWENFTTTSTANAMFCDLFYWCTALTDASNLKLASNADGMADGCYNGMFARCTNLTKAPELPATTLAEDCYASMFYYCTSLTEAPELPATTLAEDCYASMFYYCTSLTEAPELPATTLADLCYFGMFFYCTNLAKAPELPATTLADYCYSYMFQNCTNLQKAPELPATTLAEGCYEGMFGGCTNLTKAPELPATTLADYCYSYMFQNCTNLQKAPELPATTLAVGCYEGMFDGCTSLSEVPDLPTTPPRPKRRHEIFDITNSNQITPTLARKPLDKIIGRD